VKDPDALERFRLENVGEPCYVCERRPGSEAHHLTFRSQGGSDVPENLRWLCTTCHRDIHDGRLSRYAIG
jgi:5-methylcytosine-specific restriction endonuclease McrA